MSAYIMKTSFARDDSPSAETLIRAEMTVNDTLHRYPETLSVFHRHGIDARSSGRLTLSALAGQQHLELPKLLLELNHSAAGRP